MNRLLNLIKNHPEFLDQIELISEKTELLQVINNYLPDYSAEELATDAKELAEFSGSELSLDQLEKVAGGAFKFSAPIVKIVAIAGAVGAIGAGIGALVAGSNHQSAPRTEMTTNHHQDQLHHGMPAHHPGEQHQHHHGMPAPSPPSGEQHHGDHDAPPPPPGGEQHHGDHDAPPPPPGGEQHQEGQGMPAPPPNM